MSLRSRDDAGELAFSPIENEPPLRLYRMLHLVPARGLGVGRRAIFYRLPSVYPVSVYQ
jgi:hypothetical protein